MPLLQLPNEILLAITSLLDRQSILSFASINAKARNFYRESVRLRYIVELDTAGSCDQALFTEQSPKVSVLERLRYLQTRERNWREMKVARNMSTIDCSEHRDFDLYDLSAGYFFCGRRVLRKGLDFLNLKKVSSKQTLADPQGVSLAERSWWQHFHFDGLIHDFALSLHENDLIAIVSLDNEDDETHLFCIHILSFSQQRYHPAAKTPVIKAFRVPQDVLRQVHIEVAGDHIVTTLSGGQEGERNGELCVVNWCTGQILTEEAPNGNYASPSQNCGGLVFLTPSSFLIFNPIRNEADVFRIWNSADGEGRVYACCTLTFPSLVPGFSVCTSQCRADPNPTKGSEDPLSFRIDVPRKHRNHINEGSSRFGISANPLSAIISLTIQYDGRWSTYNDLPAVNFVFRRCDLINIVKCKLEAHSEVEREKLGNIRNSLPIKIMWDDWGRAIVRCRYAHEIEDWVTNTAGQRQIFEDNFSGFFPRLVVRDFNARSVEKIKLDPAVNVQSRHGGVNMYEKVELSDGDGSESEYEEDDSASLENEPSTGHAPVELDGQPDIEESPSPAVLLGEASELSNEVWPELPSSHEPEASPSPRFEIKVYDLPSEIDLPWFRNTVFTSGMPYVQYTLEGDDHQCDSFMIDEERIIGVQIKDTSIPDDEDYEEEYHLTVFSFSP